MNPIIGKIHAFVASPGDVSVERDRLNSVVNELNRTLGALVPETQIFLELVRWETHAFPDMGRPQGVINEQIGEYDVFIGILWKRFGTPTGQAESGTEEEFRKAYDNWKKDGKPHILFYFNRAATATPRTTDELDQLAKVVRFREELNDKGLIWEYDGPGSFADVVRPHLTEVIGNLIRVHASGIPKSRVTSIEDAVVPTPTIRPETHGDSSGKQMRILDVSPEDAWFPKRELLIGRMGTLVESRNKGDWYSGHVTFEASLRGYGTEFDFFEFQFEFV